MKPLSAIAFLALTLLVTATGCERPAVPQKTEATGPPSAVYVERKSEQEKTLLKAAERHHENFADKKIEQQPVNVPVPAPGAAPAAAPAVAPPATPAATPVTPAPATPAAPPATPAAPDMAPPAAAPSTPMTGTTVPAAGEVGKKSYGFYPITSLAYVREKIPMLQIDHDLQLWVTQNDRPPKDFAEFSEKILKPANIKLPELGEGESYVFDPKEGKFGTLMIRKPLPAM